MRLRNDSSETFPRSVADVAKHCRFIPCNRRTRRLENQWRFDPRTKRGFLLFRLTYVHRGIPVPYISAMRASRSPASSGSSLPMFLFRSQGYNSRTCDERTVEGYANPAADQLRRANSPSIRRGGCDVTFSATIIPPRSPRTITGRGFILVFRIAPRFGMPSGSTSKSTLAVQTSHLRMSVVIIDFIPGVVPICR